MIFNFSCKNIDVWTDIIQYDYTDIIMMYSRELETTTSVNWFKESFIAKLKINGDGGDP